MSEYNDAIQRAQRLATARDALLSTSKCTNAITSMQTDDSEIYLRWLVCHLYSIKSYIQFMKLLEWFPYMITNLIDKTLDYNQESRVKSAKQSTQQSQQSFQLQAATADQASFKSSSSLNLKKYDEKKLFINEINKNLSFIDNIFSTTSNTLQPTDETINAISFRKSFVLASN